MVQHLTAMILRLYVVYTESLIGQGKIKVEEEKMELFSKLEMANCTNL